MRAKIDLEQFTRLDDGSKTVSRRYFGDITNIAMKLYGHEIIKRIDIMKKAEAGSLEATR